VTRVAVLVSGGGSNLQALIDAHRRGELPGAEIVLVLSSRSGVYALERAKAANIPAEVIPRKELSDEDFDARLLQRLTAAEADLVILAGFLSVLGPLTLERYSRRIINVHPSLIPSFCGPGMYGLRVHEAALSKGVKVTGATVHMVNEIVDGGEILLQKAVEVLPGDTPPILQRRVMEQAEWVLLPRAVGMFCRGEIPIRR